MRKTQQTALNSSEIMAPETGLPEWVELIPAGQVAGRDGRGWNNTNPQAILEAFAAGGMDLPIDIEHSTELKAPQGEPAPAAGWIREMENRAGAIWGYAEWNETGRNLVGGRQYRYLSPVILYHPESGTIAGITSVGLTNRPNLNLQALNHQTGGDESSKEQRMDKALLAALGLPEDATTEQALAKINALTGDLAAATNHARNPSLEKFVPRGDYDAALARATNAEQTLDTIRKEKLEGEIETAIATALNAGKITPATAEYHRAQCRQDGGLQRFGEFCQAAPAIGGDSGLDGKKADAQGIALNSEQATIAAMFGNSAEDLAKYGK